ncbi:MAG: PEGA domain-containing protein, partial [Sinobacteraceae bacterium]|nr:PEGA domain-containing protein [Nevskiaceae bacterium]
MAGSASVRSLNHAEVRVREPLGERLFVDALGAGGEGADLVLPGCAAGAAMHIARRQGAWTVKALAVSPVRVNGQSLLDERHLTLHDVLAAGDAQLIVTGLSRTLLRLEVQHLGGNSTVPPERVHVPIGEESDELEISAPEPASAIADISRAGLLARFARRSVLAWQHVAIRRAALVLAALLVLALLLLSQLRRVPLQVEPRQAHIRTPGTLVALHLGSDLYLLPGDHVVRAAQAGYTDAQASVHVTPAGTPRVHLVLQRLPGVLVIDTNGVEATISIDGVESGQAPGTVRAPAGTHTLTLRAPHYVDDIESIAVVGGGQQQSLSVKLQPSWGTLQILSSTPGAQVKVDDVEHGSVPATVQVPSGVRRVLISAPGRASWQSSVVLKAATVLTIGPVALGQPGVQLRVSSDPAGAAVTLDGELRGRTPLATEVASGVRHEINISLSGYSPWQQQINGDPGQTLPLHARLQAETVRLSVEGEPQAAHVFIDGRDEGAAPRVLQLSAQPHQIEVSKPGWASYRLILGAAAGLDRHIQYHLLSAEAAASALAAASVIYTQ